MRLFFLLAGLGLAVSGAVLAAPRTYALPDDTSSFRPGLGVAAAQNHCMSCHSVDYVNFQPPRKGPAFWEAEVQKMIKVYKAPIGEADAKEIATYLGITY